MPNLGEEAVQVGLAAALDFKDWICPQYRELGSFLWRGFGFKNCMNQLFGNKLDRGEGKQMPVHYGAPELYI